MIAKRRGPERKKEAAGGIRALRETCDDFGKNFSHGTSAIADAILDRSVVEKKEKLSKVGEVSWTFMKGLVSGLQET